METIEIPAGAYAFRALTAGPDEGELVLLLHGFPQTSRSWRHQLTALGDAGYKAVAFDQRGYSPGARPDEVALYETSHLVADVLAVADWLGGHTFHLAGHDWGGGIAWQVAGRYPQRLRTLTVLSTPHPLALTRAMRGEGGSDQASRSSYMELFRSEGSDDQMLADDAAGLRNIYLLSGMAQADAEENIRFFQSDPGALKGGLNWYRGASLTLIEGLQPIETPTLYVWSTEDGALGREAAEATAQHVTGPYRFEVLEGISHWVAEQAPERVNQLLLEHLAT